MEKEKFVSCQIAQRERVRALQDGFVLDYTIQFAIVGWIVALFAIGYGVWVGL